MNKIFGLGLLVGLIVLVSCGPSKSQQDALKVQGCHDAVVENLRRRFGPIPDMLKDQIEGQITDQCKDLLGVK